MLPLKYFSSNAPTTQPSEPLKITVDQPNCLSDKVFKVPVKQQPFTASQLRVIINHSCSTLIHFDLEAHNIDLTINGNISGIAKPVIMRSIQEHRIVKMTQRTFFSYIDDRSTRIRSALERRDADAAGLGTEGQPAARRQRIESSAQGTLQVQRSERSV